MNSNITFEKAVECVEEWGCCLCMFAGEPSHEERAGCKGLHQGIKETGISYVGQPWDHI